MDCREILENFLKKNGFDGLANEEGCCCLIGDLMPCEQNIGDCMPGCKEEDDEYMIPGTKRYQ